MRQDRGASYVCRRRIALQGVGILPDRLRQERPSLVGISAQVRCEWEWERQQQRLRQRVEVGGIIVGRVQAGPEGRVEASVFASSEVRQVTDAAGQIRAALAQAARVLGVEN